MRTRPVLGASYAGFVAAQPTPDTEIGRLAYDLSLRALNQQERTVDELRARTGTLLAASAIVVSFLGAQAIDRSGFGVLGTAALAAFVVSVVPLIYILLPKTQLRFSVKGSVLFIEGVARDEPAAETYRWLANWIEDGSYDNDAIIGRLFFWFRVAAAALVLEIVLWTVHLAGIL